MNDKKMLTVFSDVNINDLTYLFETSDQPLLVLADHQQIEGIIDPLSFWKESGSNTHFNNIYTIIDRDFTLFHDLVYLNNGAILTTKYAVLKQEQDYFLYTKEDVRDLNNEHALNRLENANKSLTNEIERAREKVKELQQILNASYDEIFVTDAKGNVLFVSESVKKLTGLPPEAYLHKNAIDLEKEGILVNSVTVRTMKTKKIHSAEQTYRNGLTVFSTSKPIFKESGELFRIVSNSRDISELVEMKKQLEKMSNNKAEKIADSSITEIFNCHGIITASEEMLSVVKLTKKIAKTDSSVLINGESGVGKGVLAHMIHKLSARKDHNFVQVNCGAIPPSLIESELFGYAGGAFTGASRQGKSGLVERANGGTLFLDEIGEMPLDMQVKLLHLVQEKTYTKVGGTKEEKADIRIVSATNRNLKEMINDRTFREDLYYRLHVVPLTIPPLRERKTDILILIDYFLHKYNEKHSRSIMLDSQSKLFLQLHDYPGNVRELENLIEQIVVTASTNIVTLEQLPFKSAVNRNDDQTIISLNEAVERAEKQLLERALNSYTTTRQLAGALDVSQATITRKLAKYNLST